MADIKPAEVGQLEPKEQVIGRLKEQRAAYLDRYNALVEGKTQPTKEALLQYVEATIPYNKTLASLPGRAEGMEIFLESHPEGNAPADYPEWPKQQQLLENHLFGYMTGDFCLAGEALKKTLSGQKEDYLKATKLFEGDRLIADLITEAPNAEATTVMLAEKGFTKSAGINRGPDYWHQRADNALKVQMALLTPDVAIEK